MGDTKAADATLDVALEYGIAASVVAPYRAEIAFAEGRYQDVAIALQGLDEIAFENLQQVRDYWCGNNDPLGVSA